MSRFLKILQKHQAEIDRMIEEQQHGNNMSYSMMQSMGMLKPFAVRLPVPLIAVLDEIESHGLWKSKQEMVYDMIQSAVSDFYDSAPEETQKKCTEIQNKALDSWGAKNKHKVVNAFSKAPEAKPRQRRPRIKKGQ